MTTESAQAAVSAATPQAVKQQTAEPSGQTPQQSEIRLCVQCQAPVTTRFCGHCGRKVNQTSLLLDSTLHTAQVLTNIDGRWRRTLWDLYRRPGQLLQRYLGGERHLYANPVLMLLVLTSLSVLLLNQLKIDVVGAEVDGPLAALTRQIITYSGYLLVLSNMLTAVLTRWLYPQSRWSDRFVILTYASVFSSLNSVPLMLLAYQLGQDVISTPLLWLSYVTPCWIFWDYQRSLPRAVAMALLSLMLFWLLSALVGACVGIYLVMAEELAPLGLLPVTLGWQMVY